MTERARVLDLPVDAVTLEAAVAIAEAAIDARGCLQIATLNAEMAMQARENPALAGTLKACGLVVPDGSGVVWALRRQGLAAAKVAGVELVRALAQRASEKGHRLYFLGAQPGVAEEAARRLAASFPGLVVAGARDGFFSPGDEPAVREAIRQARPDVLFVALGVPRQELWLAEHQAALGVPVAMGVGGSFDVFAGRVRRAPGVFRALHLEWLFRLLQEPWRYQRMQKTLPRFVKEVLKQGSGGHA